MEFKSEKLKNIWNLIFSEEAVTENEETVTPETEVKAEFLDATLEDGTLVQIEPALELGAAVIVIDADGNPMAAPDAVHVLADGTQVTTVEGLITEIVPVEAEEEAGDEVEEEMEVDATESEEQKVKKVVESIIKESHFVSEEKAEELVNAIEEKFNSLLNEKVEELKNSMFKAFEQFGSTEEKEPTIKPKYGFQSKKKSKNIFQK